MSTRDDLAERSAILARSLAELGRTCFRTGLFYGEAVRLAAEAEAKAARAKALNEEHPDA